jgi:hypothetical protein
LTKYGQRLIVPEPDRFYSHGAGKPLLSAIASIPQLALLKLISPNDRNLLYYQYRYNYHAIFMVARLVQLLAGLATILIVYWILARECDQTRALIGAASVGFFPTVIEYFPNLHHDSLLAPFLVLSLYFFLKQHYKKAGLFFGLALATKNVAIFMLPVFAVQVIYNLMEARRAPQVFDWKAILRKLTGSVKAVTIAVVLFYSTRQDPLMRMCFLFLLMSLPYGLIFGYGLNYRSLQFVPFFAILNGRLIPRQYAVAFVSFLLLIDVVYCIDPITVNELHLPVNRDISAPVLLSR